MKKVIFIISVMHGGGAERVITVLSEMLVKKGYDVSIIITKNKKEESVLGNVDDRVKVFSLCDETVKNSLFTEKIIMLFARLIGKIGFKDYSAILKYYSRNYSRIKILKKVFNENKDTTVIAFLYEAIFLSLLSASSSNKLIISERGDPCQLLNNRTDAAFIKKMFYRADEMVFQSPDVQLWYEKNTPVRGCVIYNPIKSDLPEPYAGVRNRKIVNFCRISAQKNLIMLVDAFALLSKDYPDYELYIYGDAVGNGAEGYKEDVERHISEKKLERKVYMLPGENDIHNVIKDCAMFVSSSDFEGMSNSMLEAMAMGMPCVCTDCPAGGARAVITDHVNGILTPVGDAEALYQAMKELIDNPELANRLGENAVKVREEQSTEKIIKKWMEIIND